MTRLTLLLALVAAGVYFMLSDRGLEPLFDLFNEPAPDLVLDFSALSGTVDRRHLEDVLDTELTCEPKVTRIGDRLCRLKLDAYQGVPAYGAAFAFDDDRLKMAAIYYPAGSAAAMRTHLDRSYGPPGHRTASAQGKLAVWLLGSGMLAVRDAPDARHTQYFIWVSQGSLLEQALAAQPGR